MALGIVALPVFKQDAIRCKNGYFCYLYTENEKQNLISQNISKIQYKNRYCLTPWFLLEFEYLILFVPFLCVVCSSFYGF